MRHYKVTFYLGGRVTWFTVSGLVNAIAPARAFLLVTNGTFAARSAVAVLAPAGVVRFGTVPHGCVAVERID